MMIVSGISAFVGGMGTYLTFKFNPKQRVYSELDLLQKKVKVLYEKRDDALAINDGWGLTAATDDIAELHSRQMEIIQRL